MLQVPRPHDWHATQEKNRPLLRSGFVGGIPERIIRLAEMNGSLRHHAHVHDIIADLRAKLALTHRDLDICIEGIKRPYPRGALIRPFVINADRGKDFSVSNKLNADSGSTGTYIAVKDTCKITDLQMCTPASRIGVMVANGETIFQRTRVHWRCRPGIRYGICVF